MVPHHKNKDADDNNRTERCVDLFQKSTKLGETKELKLWSDEVVQSVCYATTQLE